MPKATRVCTWGGVSRRFLLHGGPRRWRFHGARGVRLRENVPGRRGELRFGRTASFIVEKKTRVCPLARLSIIGSLLWKRSQVQGGRWEYGTDTPPEGTAIAAQRTLVNMASLRKGRSFLLPGEQIQAWGRWASRQRADEEGTGGERGGQRASQPESSR